MTRQALARIVRAADLEEPDWRRPVDPPRDPHLHAEQLLAVAARFQRELPVLRARVRRAPTDPEAVADLHAARRGVVEARAWAAELL